MNLLRNDKDSSVSELNIKDVVSKLEDAELKLKREQAELIHLFKKFHDMIPGKKEKKEKIILIQLFNCFVLFLLGFRNYGKL